MNEAEHENVAADARRLAAREATEAGGTRVALEVFCHKEDPLAVVHATSLGLTVEMRHGASMMRALPPSVRDREKPPKPGASTFDLLEGGDPLEVSCKCRGFELDPSLLRDTALSTRKTAVISDVALIR